MRCKAIERHGARRLPGNSLGMSHRSPLCVILSDSKESLLSENPANAGILRRLRLLKMTETEEGWSDFMLEFRSQQS